MQGRLGRRSSAEMPTVDEEEWRYSRIDQFSADEFAPVFEPGHLLGSVMVDAPDDFAAWNGALAATPIVLDVPAGAELAAPFVLVLHVVTEGAAVFPRLVVRCGENSSVSVIEILVSYDVRALTVPVTEFAVGRAARVRHSLLQGLGPRVWQLGTLVAEVGQEATLSSGVAALGGDCARLRIDCRLTGRGAAGNVAAACLGDGDRMIDLRTFQEHAASDITSDLYFKGALTDLAHSLYTGLIHIGPDGRGSDAVQANSVVKLSEDALDHFPVREVLALIGGLIDVELDRDLAPLDRDRSSVDGSTS